jgi:hypothetical protein
MLSTAICAVAALKVMRCCPRPQDLVSILYDHQVVAALKLGFGREPFT